jgi:hypothetical protein
MNDLSVKGTKRIHLRQQSVHTTTQSQMKLNFNSFTCLERTSLTHTMKLRLLRYSERQKEASARLWYPTFSSVSKQCRTIRSVIVSTTNIMVLVRSTRSKQAHDENIVVEAGKISFIVPNCSTNGTRISELHVDRVLSFTNPCKKLEI